MGKTKNQSTKNKNTAIEDSPPVKTSSSPNTPATVAGTVPSPSLSQKGTSTPQQQYQPVHSRNAVNKAKAAAAAGLSTPGTPTSTQSGFSRTSSMTSQQFRRGGSRPGEFSGSGPMKKGASANRGFSRTVTVCTTLMTIVVLPLAFAVCVAEAYRSIQSDSQLSTKVVDFLKEKLELNNFMEMKSLPAINDNLYTHMFLPAALGLLAVIAAIKIFASSGMLKRHSNADAKKTGFESDNSNKDCTFVPTIKKARDAAILALRSTEYSRLDRDGQCYLDYTGGMLYPESLVRKHTDLLLNGTYGNPHSSNPTSFASTTLCEQARADVLKFFNADPEEYLCIFTSNASGALRIVGESFPFVENSQYLLLMDNHNSVNGIREFAISRGAKVTYARTNTSLRIDDDVLEKLLEKQTCEDDSSAPKLFAYPAQSNFSGVKHSLEWVDRAQQLGWYVLLDAAAYVPTSPLDLSAVKPDFVSMSFYKVFGYPTGIGALLMRKRCVGIMQRPWFAGGTIKFVTCTGDENGKQIPSQKSDKKSDNGSAALFMTSSTRVIETTSTGYPRDPMHVLANDHEAFEDGTINYLSLSAISYGLEFMTKLGMAKVSGHVQALTSDLIDSLSGLVHSNGVPMIHILGPNSSYKRGGTVSINVMDVQNAIIPPIVVEKLANEQMISIRSGCFCNPGDSEILFPEAWRAMMEILDEGDPLKAREIGLGIAAAIRISVGIPTSDNDIRRVIKFLSSFKNKTKSEYEHLVVCPMAAH